MRSMPNAQLILKAYTLYDMIKEQFDKNNFYQISNDDIKHDLQVKKQQLRHPAARITLTQEANTATKNDQQL